MSKYEEAEIKVINFNSDDVVTTSGGLNTGDKIPVVGPSGPTINDPGAIW